MNNEAFNEIIHPYKSVTTSCCYEMELRVLSPNEDYSEEDLKEDMEHSGCIRLSACKHSTGIYYSRENALRHLDMLSKDPLDDEILLAYIRQRPVGIQMENNACMKEWTYVNGTLHDETTVRNYDLDNNRFYGRPDEMIHHKIGDIVIVADWGEAHWGIVYATPPTPDYVKRLNERVITNGHSASIVNGSILDYSDDCYVILTTNEEYMSSHEHIQSNHIIPGWTVGIPENVERILREGLIKAQVYR